MSSERSESRHLKSFKDTHYLQYSNNTYFSKPATFLDIPVHGGHLVLPLCTAIGLIRRETDVVVYGGGDI